MPIIQGQMLISIDPSGRPCRTTNLEVYMGLNTRARAEICMVRNLYSIWPRI